MENKKSFSSLLLLCKSQKIWRTTNLWKTWFIWFFLVHLKSINLMQSKIKSMDGSCIFEALKCCSCMQISIIENAFCLYTFCCFQKWMPKLQRQAIEMCKGSFLRILHLWKIFLEIPKIEIAQWALFLDFYIQRNQIYFYKTPIEITNNFKWCKKIVSECIWKKQKTKMFPVHILGLLSWDVSSSHVDLSQELSTIIENPPVGEKTKGGLSKFHRTIKEPIGNPVSYCRRMSYPVCKWQFGHRGFDSTPIIYTSTMHQEYVGKFYQTPTHNTFWIYICWKWYESLNPKETFDNIPRFIF